MYYDYLDAILIKT